MMSVGVSLVGGMMIGVAAVSLLVLTGRIAGISGILGGVVTPTPGDVAWRVAFSGGIFTGGALFARRIPRGSPRRPQRRHRSR